MPWTRGTEFIQLSLAEEFQSKYMVTPIVIGYFSTLIKIWKKETTCIDIDIQVLDIVRFKSSNHVVLNQKSKIQNFMVITKAQPAFPEQSSGSLIIT